MARNRLTSALARGVLAVESTLTGGTLQTAADAWKQGRVVFACDWPTQVPQAEGTRSLIARGAEPILGAGAIDTIEHLLETHSRPLRRPSSPRCSEAPAGLGRRRFPANGPRKRRKAQCRGGLPMIDVKTISDEFCEPGAGLTAHRCARPKSSASSARPSPRWASIRQTDDAASVLGGNAGNLIARIPGVPDAPTVLINAHVDTVEPGCGICPQVNDTVICSDGTTVLGADDKAGCTIILTTLRHLIDEAIPHPPLEVIFTVAEEIGLYGAQALDFDALQSTMGYVLDGGRTMGVITNAAPSAYRLAWDVHGVAAHAGVCPERGINAIRVAAEAIAEMPLGRIDHETTANIGVIAGGKATNIVPELRHGPRRDAQPRRDQARAPARPNAQAHSTMPHAVTTLKRTQRCGIRTAVSASREDEPVLRLCLAGMRAPSASSHAPMDAAAGGATRTSSTSTAYPSVILATGPLRYTP
jgi:hypothetical protein